MIVTDIFISYSQKDREDVCILALLLESRGYDVWWDKNLEAADDFQEEILLALNRAKAVVVLWSANSFDSKWVRAEAAIGMDDSKLVPIQHASLHLRDLRPPFNVLHSVPIDDELAVLAAVEKQVRTPTPIWVGLKSTYREMLMFLGALGAAITIFTNLEGLIRLANWASWVRHYWNFYFGSFYSWLASLINVEFPRELTGMVTYVLLITFSVLGVRMKYRGNLQETSDRELKHGSSIAIAVIIFLAMALYLYLPDAGIMISAFGAAGILTIFIMATAPVFGAYLKFDQTRSLSGKIVFFSCYFLMLLAASVFFVSDLSQGWNKLSEKEKLVAGFCYLFIFWLIVPSQFHLAPMIGLLRRYAYCAAFVVILIGLSEFSKIGFDLGVPPTMPENDG